LPLLLLATVKTRAAKAIRALAAIASASALLRVVSPRLRARLSGEPGRVQDELLGRTAGSIDLSERR